MTSAAPGSPAAGAWPPDTSLLDAIGSAVIATDLEGRIFYWNAAAERLYGYPPSEMLGANVSELFILPDDQSIGAEIMATVAAGGSWTGEFQVRCAGGTTRNVRITDSPLLRDGDVVGVIGVAEDQTERRLARNDADLLAARLTHLARVTAELAAADSVEEVTDIVVAQAAELVGADVASLVLLEGETLRMVGVRGVDDEVQGRWRRFPIDSPVPVAEAARTGQVISLAGRSAIEQAYPAMGTELKGERSLLALPLTIEGRRLGGIGLVFPGLRNIDRQELEFLRTLADGCAHALERLEATEAARRTAARLSFLARASAELASSLDYEATLANVARLAVPELADWCAVQMLQDGQLRTLAATHVDPAKVALAVELQNRYPVDMTAPNGAPNVLRTGVSELIAEITDDMLVAAARDEQQLQDIRELGLRSALTVPLKSNSRTLGTISLIYAESDRRYTEADIAFAEDLAHRAATAIDNSDLHTQTHQAAVRLQRAVLPDVLPDVPGWELAAHYSPADRTEVGGDFYDCLSLGDGRLALVVGDVMGRGVQAASEMAAIRSAVRAFVSLDPDPAVVVTNLDRMLAVFELSQFVTLAYLVIDAARDEVTMVNAGHLPPLIVSPDGEVRAAPVTISLPLGVQPDVRTADVFALPSGHAIAVFTDGLVERRAEDIDVGVRRLVGHLAGTPGRSLQESVAELVAAMHDDERQDDVTLLVARRD